MSACQHLSMISDFSSYRLLLSSVYFLRPYSKNPKERRRNTHYFIIMHYTLFIIHYNFLSLQVKLIKLMSITRYGKETDKGKIDRRNAMGIGK